jgi:hypothetical protein
MWNINLSVGHQRKKKRKKDKTHFFLTAFMFHNRLSSRQSPLKKMEMENTWKNTCYYKDKMTCKTD